VSDNNRNIPDEGILHAVAQGMERAMQQCITQYSGLVWSIASRYVKNHTCVEDVVQETFTDLWKSANRYDPAVASESTFIGMLARRRAIDFARKQSRQPQFEPLLDAEFLPHSSTEPTPFIRGESADITAAIQELPEETRHIFSLHFDEGMTHPEISEKTGLPLGTIKTRLRRGLIEVRNKLRNANSGHAAQPPIFINS
jgi:RNA polymerase sigma-70 factor (ECF subfamily)